MSINVIVFPCGSQNGIDINFALRQVLRINLFGASSVDDHGCFIYKNYIGNIPNINEPDFIEVFNKELIDNNIEYILPTHDTVALFLKTNQEYIKAKVITSDLKTVELSRYKSKTYNHFANYNFVPRLYENNEDIVSYPVFLKPDAGQGGKGTFLAYDEEQVNFQKNINPDLLTVEYLPGEELTIDCFTDRERSLRYIFPRTRERTLAGISVRSKKYEDSTDQIRDIAESINSSLLFQGYWYFQVKQDIHGDFKLLEISTRIAGTSSINVGSDINMPLLSILDFAGEAIDIQPNKYNFVLDRCLINRYQLELEYKVAYIDLDDTLIINNQVNSYLMMFLYQCQNNGIELILLSKHTKDIYETLNNFKIPFSLFSQIIQIKSHEKKYKYIKNDVSSILIDNSFAERQQMRAFLNIPSFDVNAIEALIDWRG